MPTHENEGRYQSEASTSQAIPQTSSKPAGARREVWNRFSLTSRKGPSSTDSRISSLRPPELWDGGFLLLKPLSLSSFITAAPADWLSAFPGKQSQRASGMALRGCWSFGRPEKLSSLPVALQEKLQDILERCSLNSQVTGERSTFRSQHLPQWRAVCAELVKTEC